MRKRSLLHSFEVMLRFGGVLGLAFGVCLLLFLGVIFSGVSFERVQAGDWVFERNVGTADLNPFQSLQHRVTGRLTSTADIGLRLVLDHDRSGRALVSGCQYRFVMRDRHVPFWSLTTTLAPRATTQQEQRTSFVTKRSVVRDQNTDSVISIGARAGANSWLYVPNHGRYSLILSLYAIDEVALRRLITRDPSFLGSLERLGCQL